MKTYTLPVIGIMTLGAAAFAAGIPQGVFHDVNAGFMRSLPPEFLQRWFLTICHGDYYAIRGKK